jgi:imidazole glycerol-phosphate synthase subunit HisH
MVTIVDYGDVCVNEIASSLKKINAEYKISRSESDICGADKIILAGSGKAPAVMKKIQLLNLYSVLRVVKKPMLGIGLGMQLMADYSSEGNFPCLGFFPGKAVQFDEALDKSVYKGMHKITMHKPSKLFEGIDDKSEFYFNNSYYLPKSDLSTSTYNGDDLISASIENKNAYGVQFHPEVSGETGLRLLKNFVEI